MLRKGVSAIIVNKRNEFLLVNLESFEDKYFAIPGGGIEPGETMKEAVYREIKEELGIGKQLLDLIGACKEPLKFKFKTKKLYYNNIEYDGSERHFVGFKFKGDDNDIKLNKNEIRSYQWVSYNNLKDYLLFDNQLTKTSEKILKIFPFINKKNAENEPE